MKNYRNLLWLIPLFIWLTNPLWKPHLTTFLAPRGEFKFDQSASAVPDKQHFRMEGITITITNQGIKEWEITAEQVYTGDINQQLELIGIHAFYKGRGKDGQEDEPVIIISDRGSYFIDKRHLIFKDNVLLKKIVTGKELRTEQLHYHDPENMLISPTPVVITAPGFSLHAGRMEYYLGTDTYEFSDRIKLQL